MFGLFSARRDEEITPAQACERARKGEIYLVDVREPSEVSQMRVRGALLAPLSAFENEVGGLPADKPLAFLCLSGRRSLRAVRIAQRLGRQCCNVQGGLSAWRGAELPLDLTAS